MTSYAVVSCGPTHKACPEIPIDCLPSGVVVSAVLGLPLINFTTTNSDVTNRNFPSCQTSDGDLDDSQTIGLTTEAVTTHLLAHPVETNTGPQPHSDQIHDSVVYASGNYRVLEQPVALSSQPSGLNSSRSAWQMATSLMSTFSSSMATYLTPQIKRVSAVIPTFTSVPSPLLSDLIDPPVSPSASLSLVDQELSTAND
ncbi:unnamed protein product [Protopolystoma xenopodis]|uniref:Uncharacterized protein n=1 Tax=Protopolystoma xenopodis TaxID=117903 RepID=A0A448XIC3_9PLAT|nr:unnamed protein product [Protopolystoma xenopodis]